MQPRRRHVYDDGSMAASMARFLLGLDWKTRHDYINIMKRIPHKKGLVYQIRERMSPCELIDGLDTGISFPAEDIVIPMPNKKRKRQTKLDEFFFIKLPRI